MKSRNEPHQHPGQESFRAFLHGAATADQARQVVRHLLAGCAACGLRLAEMRKGAAVAPPPSYDLVFERVERRIRGSLEHRLAEKRAAPELYEELFRHEAIEGLIQVHSTRRYSSIALCELLLQKSQDLCLSNPAQAQTAARLAVSVAEQLDLDFYGAPVVQDLRAIAWAYVGDVQRVITDLRSAKSCLDIAEQLVEAGTGDPLLKAELLSFQASFLCQMGNFEEAVRLLNRASSIYRRLGDRHLVGRTMVRKGTVLGNSGEIEAAARLIRQGIDLIDLPREPRLMVYAIHNLVWFLHHSGQAKQAEDCIQGARQLYHQGKDRRQLGRLRWLEGKLTQRGEKAEGALAEAQDTLTREGLNYEAALAAVDLASLYASEGRAAEMRRQADEILPLFQSGDMYRETVTALTTFQRCQKDEPAALLKELSGQIRRAREEKNPRWVAAALPVAGARPTPPTLPPGR